MECFFFVLKSLCLPLMTTFVLPLEKLTISPQNVVFWEHKLQ